MKTIKNRKLKGSVLLTVVSVMALLIIFLSGTLVLATAANNRAHVNYSTAQTNITARTVVETAYKATKKDKAFATAINGLSATNKHLDIPVDISSSGTNTKTFGHVDSLSADYVGTRKFYSQVKNQWVDCVIVKIEADVTMNGVTSTSNVYLVKDPPEPPGGGGGGGAGFVTTGGAGFPSQSNLYGGSYLGIPKKTVASTYDYIANYSTYGGGYLSHEDFSFKNAGSLMEADVVINGNFDPGNLSKIVYPGTGRGITIWGNCTFSDSSFGNIGEIYSPTLTIAKAGDVKFKDIPYFYVDGEFSGSIKSGPQSSGTDNKPTAPDSAIPFNTFAGNINVNDAKFSVTGDLYLMNPDKTNTLKPKDDAKLYSWSYSVIRKTGDPVTAKAAGDIYSKGDFVIAGQKNIELQNLYIAKDLEIQDFEGTLTINGNLIVGGDITGKFKNNGKIVVTGNVYADSSSITGENDAGTRATTFNNSVKDIDDYSGQIYPDYAERDVLLGKNTTLLKDASDNDIPVGESQVVRRMDQILNDVIDPYLTEKLPDNLQTVYNDMQSDSDKIYTSAAQAKSGANTTCISWWNNTEKKVQLTYGSGGKWPVIRESCILRNFKFDGGSVQAMDPEIGITTNNGHKQMAAVVFDPGPDDMLVVLDKMEFDSPVNIIVDDSKGGCVYFYLEGTRETETSIPDNERKATKFNGALYTTKYLDLFMKIDQGVDLDPSISGVQDTIQIFTDASYALPYDEAHNTNPVPFNNVNLGLSVPATAKIYSPGAKIYGGKHSTINWANFVCCTGQIVSPNVKVNISATSVLNDIVSDKKIYYNGDIVNNFPKVNGLGKFDDLSDDKKFKYVLGCCNSEETNFNNQINMLYVPDLSDSSTPITLPDATHIFEVLYYDEF